MIGWWARASIVAVGLVILALPGITAEHLPWYTAFGLGVVAGIIGSVVTR